MSDSNYALMRDIEHRYQKASGLRSRAHYSIFYAPLRRSKFLMINANPGGTPDNFTIVDVYRGQHEYIEGRSSGPTTMRGAEILHHIVGSDEPDAVRPIQVLNRFFRRSPVRPKASEEHEYMRESRPFLEELLQFIQPEALLFGGDAGVSLFAAAHGAELTPGPQIMGPNGTADAIYYREYQLRLPYYRPIPAYGIYHPSKLNSVFRAKVFPLLKEKLGPLVS